MAPSFGQGAHAKVDSGTACVAVAKVVGHWEPQKNVVKVAVDESAFAFF